VGTGNNQLVYTFPNSVSFPNHLIAVQSVNMYYSWANINVSPLNNYQFSFTWTSAGVLTTYTLSVPDGLYEVADLNYFLQYEMRKRGMYLINAGGQPVYYAEFIVNPNRYSVQINTFPVPTNASFTFAAGVWTGNAGTAYAGWTSPVADIAGGLATFAGFPSAAITPVITLIGNFAALFGYVAGYATTTSATLNLSFNSSTSPNIQPNSSLYLSISNISNKYANPSSIIYNVTPNVGFGEQIQERPPEFGWNKLLEGTYNQLRVQLLGHNFAPVQVLDPNMTIVLVIKEDMEKTTSRN
jgi:hypothetical protein